MIINVVIDTDDMTVYAEDEDNEISIDYKDCYKPEEITIKEIINDFLT